MLDLKFIRTNADLIKTCLENKHIENGAALVDEISALDEKRRTLLFEVEELKRTAQRNLAAGGETEKSGRKCR